jgi:hypothetical protein
MKQEVVIGRRKLHFGASADVIKQIQQAESFFREKGATDHADAEVDLPSYKREEAMLVEKIAALEAQLEP